jgi:hypothetical protein
MILKKLHINIKHTYLFLFLLLLSILIVPASASVNKNETVMVIRTAGNIEKNERIQFQDYTIKVHGFHDDMVSLAVYKNSRFIELFDFYENESRMYENLQVEVLRIDRAKAFVAISTTDIRTVWSQLKPVHAFWGDYIPRDKYGVEVVSFNNDAVRLSIYELDNKLTDETYYQGSVHEYNNEFKILVTDVDSTGYVNISFFKRLPLHITGNILTEKDIYRPDEYINCSVEIRNNANMPINLADAVLITEPAMEILNYVSPAIEIDQNESHVFEFILRPSVENNDLNLKITAQVTLIDYNRKQYTYIFNKNVYISSNIGIIKEVMPAEIDLQDESRNVLNAAMVQLTFFNVGTSSKNMGIADTVPEGIGLYNSSALEWSRNIASGEVFNISYYIIPDMPGEYILPPADVYYGDTLIHSAAIPFTVHGPVIYFNKTACITDDNINVSNRIQNTGDRAADVIVIDNYPQNSSLIVGNDFWEEIMRSGETGQFNYTITSCEGLDMLPGASVQYQDITGNKWSFESEPVKLVSNIKSREISKIGLILFLLLSYLVILGLVTGIVTLIGAVIYYRSQNYSTNENTGGEE